VSSVVAADAALRIDIETARKLGVSLRRFHGWEPRTWQVTDSDGAVVIVSEPEYDEWERAIQTAYDAWRAGICDGCGQPMDESLHDVTKKHQIAYAAGFYTCRACESLELAMDKRAAEDQQAEKRTGRKPPTHQRHWFVKPVDQEVDHG